MFHLQLKKQIFRVRLWSKCERCQGKEQPGSQGLWLLMEMFRTLFELFRGCLAVLGWATEEVVKISTPLIILLPVLFSALLKAYIQSGCAEILELYFTFCLMLSLWAGSVDNGDDDLEVSGICFSAICWSIQIKDPKGSSLFLSSASRSGFWSHCLWCLGGEYWPHRSQWRAMLMLSVVYTLCQMYYGIMLYSLSRVLSLLPLCVKRQSATAARTAVNDFSWAILPRRVFIDILMSLHPFPVSGPPASKTDFLPTIGFLSCVFHNYSLTQ